MPETIDDLINEVKNIGDSLNNSNYGLETPEPQITIPEKKWYQIADAFSRNDELLEAILKSIMALKFPEVPAPPVPVPPPAIPPPEIPPDLLGKMDTLINLTGNIDNILKSLPIGVKTRVLNFNYDVDVGETVTLANMVPFDGNVTAVLIEFPLGCNSLVDVSVKAGTRGIVPEVGYVSLNDVTPTFVIREPVVLGEDIIVEIQNRDTVNAHSIEVDAIIIEG